MKKTIIITIIFITLQLSAYDHTHWTQIVTNYFSADAENDLQLITGATIDESTIKAEGTFGFQLKHETSATISKQFSVSFQDVLFYSDLSHQQKNSFMYNDAILKLFYKNKQHYFKIQYSNRSHSEEYTVFLNSPSLLEDIQQRSVHNTYLVYKTNFDKLDISLLSNIRNLDYRYAWQDDGSDDEWNFDTAWDNDWITNFVTGYQASDAVRIFGKAYYKDDLNENDDYNHLQTGVGIEYDNRFDFFNSLSARFTYLNNQSDAIAAYKEHYFLSEARYTRRFNSGFAGFISLINRSCYDQDQSKLLRISNVMKMHLKYSYLIENSRDSFVLAGIKYNPENEGNLILGELNQFIVNNLYLGAGAKYAPELYSQFVGKIEYLISPVNSVWIKNEYTDFENKFGQNVVSFGATLLY